MLISRPTKEMVANWKKVFHEYRGKLTPNRKTGVEVDNYFRAHYQYNISDSQKAYHAVYESIMSNDCFSEKLPEGKLPIIKTYMVNDVFVGIDIETGHIQVEPMNDKAEKDLEFVKIYDDLFRYRGLDEKDLDNFYLVAEYVRLSHN